MNRNRKTLGPDYVDPTSVVIDWAKDVVLLRVNNATSFRIVDGYKAKFAQGRFGEPPQVILVNTLTPQVLRELEVSGSIPVGVSVRPGGRIYAARDGHHRIRAACELGVSIKARVVRVIE